MRLEHEFTVPVTVEQAWAALLDIGRIAACAPGASVTHVEADSASGSIRVKAGAATVTYRGTAAFLERDAAAHRVVVRANGRETSGRGTARATVTGTLTERDDGTAVTVLTELTATGRPGRPGPGEPAGAGERLIGRFASCLARDFVRAAAEPTPGDTADRPAASAPPAPGGAARRPAPDARVTGRGAAGRDGGADRDAYDDATAPPVLGEQPAPEPIDLLRLAGRPVVRRAAAGAAATAAVLAVLAGRRRLIRRHTRRAAARGPARRRL